MSVESRDAVVKQFLWNDQGYSMVAAEVLCVLTTLVRSQLSGNYIDNKTIVAYLQAQDLIEETAPNSYRLKDGKQRQAVGLGNRISSEVGKEINKIVSERQSK